MLLTRLRPTVTSAHPTNDDSLSIDSFSNTPSTFDSQYRLTVILQPIYNERNDRNMLGGPPSNRFGREAHAVRIDNIAGTVGRHEIIDLFSNLIGQVRRCEEVHNGQERWMDMAFFSRDCARKALCMSGYTVSGVPLYVTRTCFLSSSVFLTSPLDGSSVQALAPAHSQRRQDRFNQPDERRNLYVLGLPFNLTK
jgi:hypothetical protein